MRKKVLIALFVSVSFLLSGCEEIERVAEDTATEKIEKDPITNKPSLNQELEVKDENFKLNCEYDLGNYELESWRVTDSKNVGMSVKTKNLPDGYTVTIDHVHADIILKSTSAQINGITQDTMDDTYHGYNQDGFYIDNDTEYYNIFSIEGYTDKFYELWGYAFGNLGQVDSSYERLTEKNIIRAGTYAEKLTVVYDLSIKKPGKDKNYTKSVISEILIPLNTNSNNS